MLSESPFDLVMLDLRMPGIDGIETCTRIRARFGASLPVLMLTGAPDSAPLRQAYEAGADDFLQKPVDTHRAHPEGAGLPAAEVAARRDASATASGPRRAPATWRCCTRSAATGR